MATLIVEPGNPHDLTEEEERELLAAASDAAPDDVVRVVRRPEEGYGVTLQEVLHVFVENLDLATAGAGALAGLVKWLRARWKKDGRTRVVLIYGPDGRPLKTIRIAEPDGDPVEEPPDGEKRNPPAV